MMKDLEEMRQEKIDAEEMTALMAQDLCSAQEKAQEKGEQLNKKEIELRKCEEDLDRVSREAKDLKASLVALESQGKPVAAELVDLREQVKQLTSTLHQKDIELASAVSSVSSVTVSADEKLNVAIQAKLFEFDTKLRENEENMRVQLAHEQEQRRVAESKLLGFMEKMTTSSSQEHELRRAAEAELQSTTKRFEAQLKETVKRADTQIAELQNRMEIQVDHEPLLERISSLEAEILDTRKRYQFFLKNNENLSRNLKDSQADVRRLEESVYLLQRRLNELNSQDLRNQQMPGAY
jgi:chromosome segregation ATPase